VSAEFCCSATLISVLFRYFFYDSVLSWPPSCLFYSVLSCPGIIESVSATIGTNNSGNTGKS
jgi:hypothetical protein